jgi:hypothetical protein
VYFFTILLLVSTRRRPAALKGKTRSPKNLLTFYKIQRRVSFSDPIAVFKTMSPEDLTKEEEVEGEIYDDEVR